MARRDIKVRISEWKIIWKNAIVNVKNRFSCEFRVKKIGVAIVFQVSCERTLVNINNVSMTEGK